MSKKKKSTTLETNLKELYLKFVEALKYNPDLWDKLQCPLEDIKEEFRADLVEPSLSNDDPLEAMRELHALAGLHDYFLCLELALTFDDVSRFFPVIPAFKQIKSWMSIAERIEECKCGKSHRFPKLVFQAEDQGLLILFINLRYSNNAIIESLNRAIDYVLSLNDVKWREYMSLVPVLFDAEKEDYSFCKSQPIIAVAVQFSAGKMKIRQAVRELLDKYTPREAEPTRRFHIEKWEEAYRIYELHKDEGYSFKDISVKLNIPESTVKSAYQRIYLHIHQEDEYGTKETRGELCVNIADRSPMPLQDAERKYARAEMLGGSGNKMAPSGSYEDGEATFYDWKAELAERGKAFENWRKRFGQSIECWDCKRVPGSVVCSGCNQAIERKYLSRGLKRWYIEPGKAVKRAPLLERRSPYPLKGEREPLHYIEIYESVLTQHLRPPREQELVLQAEYIENHGTIRSSPWQAPKPEDDGAVWILPRPSVILRKDEIESRLIDEIDLQARKSHHPY